MRTPTSRNQGQTWPGRRAAASRNVSPRSNPSTALSGRSATSCAGRTAPGRCSTCRNCLDTFPPHPRRARGPRGGGGRGRRAALRPVRQGALPLARLGRARQPQAVRLAADGRPRVVHEVRQRRAPALPPRVPRQAQRHAPTEGHLRDHVGRRAGPHRHRAEPARRARQGGRHPRRGHRPHARLPALAGLRGPAAQDGREGQRRRPVLHPPRGDPRDGAGDRPPARRDGLRPRLRHRRLPRPSLRAHARQADDRHDRRSGRSAEAPHVLRPREGEPHLPDRSGQPRLARDRPAEPLARQHPHRRRGVRRLVRGRPDAVRRHPDEPALRRQGRQGRANRVRLQDQRHAGLVPPARHRRPWSRADVAASCSTRGSCSARTRRPS